jgi:hypothetical protein
VGIEHPSVSRGLVWAGLSQDLIDDLSKVADLIARAVAQPESIIDRPKRLVSLNISFEFDATASVAASFTTSTEPPTQHSRFPRSVRQIGGKTPTPMSPIEVDLSLKGKTAPGIASYILTSRTLAVRWCNSLSELIE